MEGFLDAPFPAIRGQAPDLIQTVHIPEEEIVFPQDGRLMHLRGLGLPVPPVFEPVLQNPDLYLMPRYAPFEELPDHWEVFSGDNYLGVHQHLQEELDAPEQVEDMDNEEEDLDDEEENYLGMPQLQEELDAAEQVEDMDHEEEDVGDEEEDLGDEEETMDDEEETMDCTKTSSEDVDAFSSASQQVTKRVDSTSDDCRLLKDIGSSSSSVATIGLQDPAMPDASQTAFVPILEPVTRISNNLSVGAEAERSDQVDGLGG